MTYTPGPWVVESPELCASVIGSDGYRVAYCNCGDAQTDEYNARLIAAAPELIAALAEVFADNDAVNRLSWIDRAAGALSKAKGE